MSGFWILICFPQFNAIHWSQNLLHVGLVEYFCSTRKNPLHDFASFLSKRFGLHTGMLFKLNMFAFSSFDWVGFRGILFLKYYLSLLRLAFTSKEAYQSDHIEVFGALFYEFGSELHITPCFVGLIIKRGKGCHRSLNLESIRPLCYNICLIFKSNFWSIHVFAPKDVWFSRRTILFFSYRMWNLFAIFCLNFVCYCEKEQITSNLCRLKNQKKNFIYNVLS